MTKTRSSVGVGDFPRLSRFYGISPDELRRTPNWLLRIYAEQLEEIRAEETLLGITVSTMPHAVEKDRDRIMGKLARAAGYEEPSVPVIDARTKQGRKALAGLGIGLRIDSSTEKPADA